MGCLDAGCDWYVGHLSGDLDRAFACAVVGPLQAEDFAASCAGVKSQQRRQRPAMLDVIATPHVDTVGFLCGEDFGGDRVGGVRGRVLGRHA